MKIAALLLLIVNLIAVLALAAFAFKYTVLETVTGGEWLILKAEQAAECRNGGCAVFSQREFDKALNDFANYLIGRMSPKL